jgi:hypothetical protein
LLGVCLWNGMLQNFFPKDWNLCVWKKGTCYFLLCISLIEKHWGNLKWLNFHTHKKRMIEIIILFVKKMAWAFM